MTPEPAEPAQPSATLPAAGLLLIVNPSAAGGRTLRRLSAVEAALAALGVPVETALTRSLEHADELVAQAAAAGQVAVAYGGDGLLGRVAGAASTCGAVVAALPGGRGNDFLRTLGVGADPVAAAAALADAVERRLDLGVANGRHFVGIASVGFDSDVQVLANRTRFIRGAPVYTYAALRTLLSWKPCRFTVEIDGEPVPHIGWSVAAGNAQYYGGGMRYAPTASLTDGALDVILAAESSRPHFLTQLPRVFSGRHIDDGHVTVRRARRLSVDAERPFQLYADGDPIADLPAVIEIQPGALRMLIGRYAKSIAPRAVPGISNADGQNPHKY